MKKSRFIDYTLDSEHIFMTPKLFKHATSRETLERRAERKRLMLKAYDISVSCLFGIITVSCFVSLYIGLSILAHY